MKGAQRTSGKRTGKHQKLKRRQEKGHREIGTAENKGKQARCSNNG